MQGMELKNNFQVKPQLSERICPMQNLPQIPLTLAAFDNFEAASRTVLALLHQRLGFGLWMTTRTEENDWIVLQVEDHGYNVEEGTVFRWADSFEEARARRYGSAACVLMVDLDNLKQVNDTEGHAQGDVLLRKTARTLRSALRLSDVVARIGEMNLPYSA